jgi:MFS transporter, DHA3 family, macrolide efflux protein
MFSAIQIRVVLIYQENKMNNIKRLWNKNFSILWQGQLISDFGNAAFTVALGFWVLEATKSALYPFGNTALMGLILACFAIPGVVLGPVAGAFADRHNRKLIIVAADFVRGVLFALMGLTVYLQIFPFVMIYPLAIMAGACGAFFGPAISSVIPDIVSTDDLSKANSARSFSSALTQLLGSSLGGLLYSMLTAPILILINGISFLYASVTQLFMKLPAKPINPERKNILHDIAEGIKYTFGNRGIRTLVLTGMLINFFAVCGMTLMTPLFTSEPNFGVKLYGYIMGTMMAGMIIGMVVFSIVKIKPSQRAGIFGLSMMVMVFSMVPVGIIKNVYWLFPFAFLSGITNAIVNVMLQTILQTTVAAENRGKVFGILGTVMGGLQPIAMAVSGVFGLLVGIRPAITISFSLLVLAALPLLFDKHFKAYINTDTTADALPEIPAGDGAASVLAPAEE